METNKSVYLQLFGDYPINRVLDFLVVNEDFDYSMVDIAKNSGIGYATLKMFWPFFAEHKIVLQTRKIGNAKLYTLNRGNPTVKKFREFYWSVTTQHVHKELEKEGLVPRARVAAQKKLLRKTI